MNNDAVKDLILFRMSAEEPLLEVGRIEAVVLGDFIAVRVDPLPTIDAGGDRIVFAMIMQLYPLDADRLVEAGNFDLRRVIRASRPLADREAISAPLHLFRDGGPLVVIASDSMAFVARFEFLLEAGWLPFPAMRRREYPRQGYDDFLLCHFFVCCFHDSKLIAISRRNAGILHYLPSVNGNYVASDSSVFAAKTASSDNLCRGGGFRYSPIRIVGVDIPMQAEIL